MSIPEVTEKFSGAINTVDIGAQSDDGGTRTSVLSIGGDTGLPLAGWEADIPNSPAFAMQITNGGIDGWIKEEVKHVGDLADDVGKWAAKCEEWGADAVCLKLDAAHPDIGRSADECADDVRRVLENCGLPLIIWGVDAAEVDDVVLPKCSQAAAGENCLIASAKEDDYRTLAASCMADGHKLVAESPSDINLAKQVNILIRDVGYPLENIVMHPTTGALGFGMIYIYSVMERARNAALNGDKLLQQPVIVNIGEQTGRVKEANAGEEEYPEWGRQDIRAPLWEAATAIGLVEAGAALCVLRNPEALSQAREAVGKMLKA